MLLKGEQVRNFVQQGYQKRIFVEVTIYADAVIFMRNSVAVIAQKGIALPGDG
jgi:hypothetical protein